MTEKQVEAAFNRYCAEKKVICWKFVSPGRRGVPDRLLIGPRGNMGFVELKRPGKRPTVTQKRLLKQLEDRNVFAAYVDNLEDGKMMVDNFIAFDALQ